MVVGEHPSVAGGISQAGGEQGDAGAAAAVALQKGLEGFGTQEGNIAIQHEQIAAETRQGLQELLYGMAGAVLGLLQHEFQPRMMGQGLPHPIGLMPNDQDPALGGQHLRAVEHPLHQGGARQGLEHLGERALHARALSGGQDGDGEHQTGRKAGGNLPASQVQDLPIEGGPWHRGVYKSQRRRQALLDVRLPLLSAPAWAPRRLSRMEEASSLPLASR